jgi:hypothetical protein
VPFASDPNGFLTLVKPFLASAFAAQASSDGVFDG